MMNVYSYQIPIQGQNEDPNNYRKFSSNTNQDHLVYPKLVVTPSSSNNGNPSFANEQYTQGMTMNEPVKPKIEEQEAVQKSVKKIKKKNAKKQIDPKMLLPKTLQSLNKPVEESSSANSCLQSNESMQPISFFHKFNDSQQQCQYIQPFSFQYIPKPSISGMPLPKLQQDILPSSSQQQSSQLTDSAINSQKQNKMSNPKKPKKENVNTGHWTQEEHNTYIEFLSQYEDIMTSSAMKKTSKIFKQMSELIGSRTPSQCRSHHQKFNPYALRGENGKRLPRNERSRAGRKRKTPLQEKSDLPLLNQDYLMNQYSQFNEQPEMFYYQNDVMLPPEFGLIQQQQQQEWQDQMIFQSQIMQPKLEEVNYDSLRERRLDDQKYLGGDIYESFFKSPHRQAHKYSDGNMVIPNVDLNQRNLDLQL